MCVSVSELFSLQAQKREGGGDGERQLDRDKGNARQIEDRRCGV